MTFSTQKMLDNAAMGSQARQLLEPETRGAILRSIAQWIELRDGYSKRRHAEFLRELQADKEYDL